MGSIKIVTTFLTLSALFGIGLFIAIATGDPLIGVVTSFDLGGMNSQATAIHESMVKWIVPVFLGSILMWAVYMILREERQTVR